MLQLQFDAAMVAESFCLASGRDELLLIRGRARGDVMRMGPIGLIRLMGPTYWSRGSHKSYPRAAERASSVQCSAVATG